MSADSRPDHAAARPVVIPVTGGVFNCEECGARWVGTWHGDPALMKCRYCGHPMNEGESDD